MSLIISGEVLIYLMIAVGFVFLFFGFYAIKPLAALTGLLIGYFVSMLYMPLQSPFLGAVSIFIGIVLAGLMFAGHLSLPFLIGAGVVFAASYTAMDFFAFPAEPYHFILFAVLSLIIGLSVFVAKDYFVIIWTSLFGALLITLAGGYLYLLPSRDFLIAAPINIIDRILSLIQQNAVVSLFALVILFALGLIIQLFLTSNAQLFIKRRYAGRHRQL